MYRLLRGHYSSFLALTDSCANPMWLSPPSVCSLVRGVCTGCFQSLLPPGSSRRYLCKSVPGCLVPYPDGPTECICLFLPRCHRPSLDPSQVGFPFRPRTRFFRGEVSRLSSDISYVQASEFACLPDRSHRCNFRRAAETFTSRRNVLRCLCTHRICYPSATGN